MKISRSIGIVFLIIATLLGQSKDNIKEKDGNFTSKLSKINQDEGQQKYLRFTVHDGNLITGGILNSGSVSYNYVSGCPLIKWPKGPKAVPYLWCATFFVASEVVDANGDTIAIVSDNFRRYAMDELSFDQSHMYSWMPKGRYFNMDEPGAQETPEVYGISEDVGLDGIPGTNDEGEGDLILQHAEDFNNNDELDLSMKNKVGWYAINDRRETWPEYWPAGSYPGDPRNEGSSQPGPRAGMWNGRYGAYARADQESYYVMDDSENDEFEYYPTGDERSWPEGRRGLGLNVEVRNYQWSSRLAEDIFISVYDVTNEGKDLDPAVVGMYVDPDMGGAYEGDDADFDNLLDITYAWNKNFRSEEGLPMGYFGFAFLESPGIADDGIDNDEDGMTDESQNNGIDDDEDWQAWEDLNGNGVWDNEDANHNFQLDPGEDLNGNGKLDIEPLHDDKGADGLGPFDENYPGYADAGQANGTPDLGEPNFEFTDNDESDQVGLTSFYLKDVDNQMARDQDYWDIEIKPETYKVRPGYERDIAWSYGSGYVKLAKDKTHRYAIALLFGNTKDDILRNKRTMQEIYDNDYNFASPPRKPIVSATSDNGKVYLSWGSQAEQSIDPIYGQDFEAYRIYKTTDPTFEEIKTVTDAFGNPLIYKPVAIYDKINGLKGAHPVTIGSELGEESNLGITYNMGTDSGLKHFYEDGDVINGYSYYYAVVSIDRGYHESFYPDISDKQGLLTMSPTVCGANIKIDPLGRPISYDQNTIRVIPQERPAGYVAPALNGEVEHINGQGTGSISVELYNPRRIKDNTTYRVEFMDDGRFNSLDTNRYTGITNRMVLEKITDNDTLYLESVDDPNSNHLADEFIKEGVQVKLQNDTLGIKYSDWQTGSSTLKLKDMTEELAGNQVKRDYEIRIGKVGADTSYFGTVTNFQIWDVTEEDDPFQLSFYYIEGGGYPNYESQLKPADRIILLTEDRKQLWKWDFFFPDEAEKIFPEDGDVYSVTTTKPFDRNDVFEFTVQGNYIEDSKIEDDLDNIYVVPNPYVGASSFERHVVNEEEGRGPRRVDFVNLPTECTIHIFTSSGKLVRKLEHNTSISEGRESWDLRTKDGLEISYGVYFYAVETPDGKQTLGKFSVIK